MDISFGTPHGRFNYRVCAVILREEKLLVMQDECSPYYYLPGGRVRLHETAEAALKRELREELEVEATILRPLWLNQGFFREDASGEQYHELCLYFLVDVSGTAIPALGETFTLLERQHTHRFTWMPIARLSEAYLYPEFIKREIFHLPEQLTLREEYE